jgi:hypothetical protein
MTFRSSQTRIERGMPSCAASYLARAGHVLTHAMSEEHETEITEAGRPVSPLRILGDDFLKEGGL